MGLVGQPVDIHISLIRNYFSRLDWQGLERGRMLKMLKRNIGLQFNGRDFDDGNEWQHHVDCLEGGIPQELRQVFFDNGGRLLASFHSDALLQTFCGMQQRQRICKSPAISHLIPLSSWPLHAQDRPNGDQHMCHQSIM